MQCGGRRRSCCGGAVAVASVRLFDRPADGAAAAGAADDDDGMSCPAVRSFGRPTDRAGPRKVMLPFESLLKALLSSEIRL